MGDGISIKPCRSDMGLEVALYRATFAQHHSFELEERRIKIPVDITGFNAKPQGWIALELVTAPDLIIAAAGDLLAVRRARAPRNGQIAIIKLEERVLIKRIFINGDGLVLRSLDSAADILIKPSAIDVRGTIEGLALEGCWYKLITSEKVLR